MSNKAEKMDLKILMLEDSFRDLELISEQLKASGFILDLTHVETEPELRSVLEDTEFNIILSDFKLINFDAFGALRICQEFCPDTPFICISGSIGEETAIELLKAGAVDYVFKDHPHRLPFAISRAIEEAQEKVLHKKAAKALQESEHRFKQVAKDAQEWIWEVNNEGIYTYASPVIESLLGYTADEIIGKKSFFDFFVPDQNESLKEEALNTFSSKESFKNFINSNLHKDGRIRILSSSGSPILDDSGTLIGYRGVDTDITEQKESEMALYESEEKFRNLFNNHSAVKLIVDPEDGKILEANNAAEKFYGWNIEDLKEKKIQEINTMPDEEVFREMNQVLANTKTHFEFVHQKADGSLSDVEVFSSTVEIGGKKYVHSIIHDISEKKKAETQLRLLNKAVESSSIAITITDLEGRIIYANPFFLKNSGYTLKEVLGNTPRILRSGYHSIEFYQVFWNTILAGKEWEGEILNKRKNGELYWVNAIVSPITNKEGKITHFVAIKENINEKKKILEELVKAKNKAEESDKLKSAFLNNISHEIRTPLNGILGFGEIWADVDLSPKNRQEIYASIRKSGTRLLNTINDYIDMARIFSGTMEINKSDFKLIEVIQDVIEGTQHLNDKKNQLQVQVSSESNALIIHSDKEFIRRILTILMDNAYKFTNEGEIAIGYQKINTQVEIWVRDSGSGIDEENYDLIFEMFSQEDSSNTRGYEGSGLGLSIAKGLVDILDGTITVNSSKAKGSVFTISIPYTESQTLVSGNKKTKTGKLAEDILILIAEDDLYNFMYMDAVLSNEGFKIIHAENGQIAVDFCKSEPDIALVLMDIKMPVMGGLEATRLIQEFRPDLTIIATTAYAQIGDEKIIRSAGCIDYLKKPFLKDQLLSMIKIYT